MIDHWQLVFRQNLPLKIKEQYSLRRIKNWYDAHDGQVYVSFSGGKDSTVLLHLVRKLYPSVPAVFVDTGLEYPEIREFVRTIDNVVWLKPKMKFPGVVEKYGYPVVSKKISRMIRDLQKRSESNNRVCELYLTGKNQKGIECPSRKLSQKWKYLIDSPFKISEKCCDELKKKPFKQYEKVNKRYPIVGTMAHESTMRKQLYLKNSCNGFNLKHPVSVPISFWKESDIWDYIEKNNISYSKIYDIGEKRTGCMFCMFGVHLEKGENRFQRMKKTHPKMHDYCINKLNLKQCLDYIGVSYGDYPSQKRLKFTSLTNHRQFVTG